MRVFCPGGLKGKCSENDLIHFRFSKKHLIPKLDLWPPPGFANLVFHKIVLRTPGGGISEFLFLMRVDYDFDKVNTEWWRNARALAR